ncbi:MAG: FAD-dependent oxidoreductase [Thermoleophilia bacterium]
MRYVIVGNGVAGITAADTIRELDPDGSITFVARESFPPYCRPMISNLVAGTAAKGQLPIRPDDYYERLGANAYLGVEAVSLSPGERRIALSNGASLDYDRLLVATGADPRPIEAENIELDNIFYLRTIRDATAICDAMPQVEHALVLGGGLVGFKAAHGFLARGKRVTMLIRSGYPLSLQVDETAGQLIQAELERHGLEVRTGVEAVSFSGDERNRVREAILSDGTRLECEAVVIGKGVFPSRSWLPSEVRADAGVLVDDHLATSLPDVYAAGDVAEHRDVARDRPWVNAIWPVAVEMGRIAGSNMAGRRVRYEGSLSRNVIRIFSLDVMTAGIVSPRESEGLVQSSRYDRRRGTYRKLLFREDGSLAGFVLVNDIEQGGVLMNLVHRRRGLDGAGDSALGPHFNVGRLLDVGRR